MQVAFRIAIPLLLVGLVIGLVISVFQAVTQIQEQTLTFIPKISGSKPPRRSRTRSQ
jgi:flagellar biosynthetic protein FliQ